MHGMIAIPDLEECLEWGDDFVQFYRAPGLCSYADPRGSPINVLCLPP